MRNIPWKAIANRLLDRSLAPMALSFYKAASLS
jgi:hypothetical protein